jgi:hypothetical protein
VSDEPTTPVRSPFEDAVFAAADALKTAHGTDQVWLTPVGDIEGDPVAVSRIAITSVLPGLADAVSGLCGVCASTGDAMVHAGCPYESAAKYLRGLAPSVARPQGDTGGAL